MAGARPEDAAADPAPYGTMIDPATGLERPKKAPGRPRKSPSLEELKAARESAKQSEWTVDNLLMWDQSHQRALDVAALTAWVGVDSWKAASAVAIRALGAPGNYWQHLSQQAALLRDMFGNPFRPVTADPAWLSWNDGTVVRLARAIYDECRFQDLPVLADALEEAGCAEPGILGPMRRKPTPHLYAVRVLYALLGVA